MSENREREGEIVRRRRREAGGGKGAGLSRHSSPAMLRSPVSAGRRGRVEGDGELREELGRRQGIEPLSI